MPNTTRFNTVPLNIAGPSYQARSLPLSAQRSVNLFPEVNQGALSELVLQSWRGLKLFSAGSATDRGMHVLNSTLYHVAGTSLQSVDSAGTRTTIGTIAGSDYCSMENNGTTMVICNGATPYAYNGGLTALTSITFNPKVVTYLNNQFIFDGDDGRFSVADSGNTSVNAANYATPESAPDALVAPYVFNQILYLYGTKTIEPWDNTGSGSPPYERMNGGIIEDVGISSPHGIASTSDAMYFIGSDGIGYRITSFQAEPITRPAQAKEFQSYTLSDILAFSIAMDGQKFCVFVFPSSKKCWAYSETANSWFELDHGTKGERYIGSSYAYCYGKHLIADYRNGNIYELDIDTFTNNGDPIVRQRVVSALAGETFGKPRYSLEMSKLRISMETGVGLTTGQGENPTLMVDTSLDGGKTYGQEYWIDCGTLGETVDVTYDHMDVSKQFVYRLRASDPVRWTFYTASVDVREAGY